MKNVDKRRNRTEIEQQRRKPHAALLGLQRNSLQGVSSWKPAWNSAEEAKAKP
jgi:hypothetical protein